MSHLVRLQTKVHDPTSIASACQRLNLAAPVQGTVELFSGKATGQIVKLPGWEYPVAIDTTSGTISYDNYGGHWGKPAELDKFLQAYAVERAKLEARRKGFPVNETQLQDGSIKLSIQEGYA